MHLARNASEETRVVVCGGTKDVPLLVQPDSLGVVVVLMKKFHLRAIGLEAEGSRSEIEFFSTDLAIEPGISDRCIDPVVQTVTQIARPGVRIPGSETSKEDFANISLVVTVRILEEQEVRSMGKDYPAPGKGHGSRDVKSLRKNGELVRFAIPVGILANLDPIIALPTILDLIRIVHRLHNPKPSPFVPLKIDRIDDLRLGGKELKAEANRDLRVLYAILGGKRKLEWQRFGPALVVRDIIAFLVLQGSATGYKSFVALADGISHRPKNSLLDKIVKFGVVPGTGDLPDRFVGQGPRTGNDPYFSRLVNVTWHNPDLALTRRNDTRAIRPDQTGG